MSEKNFVNYYFILNVSSSASSDEIKKAYLRLVKTYHPDKNKGSRLAEKKFQQINKAWEILKDSDKRKLFDENLRKSKLLKQEQLVQIQVHQQNNLSSLEKKKEKAIDLECPLKVSLEDLCQLKVKNLHYLKSINGKKLKSNLKIQIPLGAKEGTRLLFKGEGGAEGKKEFGNLYVKILIKKHKILKRLDNSFDLMLEYPISFIASIQSEKLEVLSPYGFLSLKVPLPILDKQILKVKNYGLIKDIKNKGDLFIKFFIEYPSEKGTEIEKTFLKMPYEQQKIYIEQFKNANFIYPKVLKFQKKLQELKKEYYPNE